MNINAEWEKIQDDVIAWYHTFHQNPEIGKMEQKTADYVAELLSSWGIEVKRIANNVIGTIYGKGDRCIALRADMDALPITEENDVPFASKNLGIMHACGHDLHTAALLGAACILAKAKDELKGNVKFIFESDEEGDGSAKYLIEQGVLTDPVVDKIYGIHVRPEMLCGTIGIKYGKSYAAADIFNVKIIGKSAHGAEPDNGIDTIFIASQVIQGIQSIISRNLPPTSSAVISVGEIHGGTASNIIAGETTLKGIIRTFGEEERRFVKESFVNMVENIANSFGAKTDIHLKESYPGVVNDNQEADFIKDCATELFTDANVVILEEPTLTTEDFGYFLHNVAGCFYHVGVESSAPLHSNRFLANGNALKTMTLMHLQSVLKNME